MGDLNLVPPALPGEQRKREGFLKRFLFKGEEEAPAAPPQDELADIRRKLGLDDEPEAAFQAPPVQPKVDSEAFLKDIEPAQEVEIHDWASDAKEPSPPDEPADWIDEKQHEEPVQHHEPSSWDAPPDAPAHHEAVEKHFDRHEQAATQAVQKAEQHAQEPAADVPEWTLQDKEVHPQEYFILRNGHTVRSLKELIDAVDYIDDTTFEHHVTEHRNDFASWIEHVIGNPALAQEVRDAKDRAAIVAALEAHREQAIKDYENGNKRIKTLVTKRQQAAKQLAGVETKIKTIKTRIDQQAKQLSDHKQLSSKLVKSALDEEVDRRIAGERKEVEEERARLEQERGEFEREAADHKARIAQLEELERTAHERERKATDAETKAQEQRTQLAQERAEAAPLLAEAERLRKEFEGAKKARLQTEQNLKEIAKRETALSRQEETIRQRERKLTADLTRLHEQQEKLTALKAEHDAREAKCREQEAESKKLVAEAKARMDAALDAERKGTSRLKEQTRKLDAVRKRIETTLAKVLKNKQKMQSAVQLRKHLEEQILAEREEVVRERKAMEDEAYASYVQSRAASTPIGQPASPDDVLPVKDEAMHRKLEQARAALAAKDLSSAKRIYNELREEFAALKADAPERNALYTGIRELYDDIHLALLEQ